MKVIEEQPRFTVTEELSMMAAVCAKGHSWAMAVRSGAVQLAPKGVGGPDT